MKSSKSGLNEYFLQKHSLGLCGGLIARIRDRRCVTAKGWWRHTGSMTVSTTRRWLYPGSPFTSHLPTPRRNLARTRYTNGLFMYFSSGWRLRFPWILFACRKHHLQKNALIYIAVCWVVFRLVQTLFCVTWSYIVSRFKSVKVC